MNSKKPYLHHYSRKVTVPYLLDQDETLLQMQLFDYLSGFAAKDKVKRGWTMLRIAVLDDERIFYESIERKIYSFYEKIHLFLR